MSKGWMTESCGRLRVGQFVRMTKTIQLTDKLPKFEDLPKDERGLPYISPGYFSKEITEGLIKSIRYTGGGDISVVIGTNEFFIGVTLLGPLLNHFHQHLEILEEPPVQYSLIASKCALA
jgi:hypothetical protein